MAIEDLARAVLLQAMCDALTETKSKKQKNPSKQEKLDAIRFLQGKSSYRESLEMWCQLCGANPDKIKKMVFSEDLQKKHLTIAKLRTMIANVVKTERRKYD